MESGRWIFGHGAASTPTWLIEGLLYPACSNSFRLANLLGVGNESERAEALIAIVHSDDRDILPGRGAPYGRKAVEAGCNLYFQGG